MAIAKRLNLRLFIDGIEVPVIGARCTFAEGSDGAADIQVIATDQVYDITPRSMITVFYYEDADYAYKSGQESGLGVMDPRRWKLLFAGELVAIRLQKTDGQRHAVLSCTGPMNYLDFIRQHYLNFRNGGIEMIENAFMGVTTSRIKNYDVIGKGVNSNLFVWLSQSKVKVDGKEYSNIYTGTQRVIREMFFASSNFYAQAYNRWRIGEIVVGIPEDKTAAKLMKLDFFKKYIENRVGGGGGQVSARQMVQQLLSTVMHTMTTIPCPWLDKDGKALGTDIQSANTGLSSVTAKNQTWAGASLNYVVIKPDTWFLAPPVCNIVFPHQYSTMAYQRNYLAEPTRLMLRTSLFFTGRDKWLTERFYAPDFSEVAEMMYREGSHLDRMAEVLMPHEQFVGLNPIFLWDTDLGAYVQKGGRREYLSKLCDYMYWKYRFGTRSTNVSGPFNPNLVPGYPGLVMDRAGIPGSISRHVMGNVQSVVHSIDQQGGQTHFTMTGCYLHDETSDFDNEGRSVYEVTRRGTDGFLDDRYDWERIGEEVYQTVFGCGSLFDVISGVNEGDLADLVKGASAGVAAAFEPVVTKRKVKKTRKATRQEPEYKEELNTATGGMESVPTGEMEDVEFQESYWVDEEVTSYDSKALVRAVAYLQLLYQTILQSEGNLQAFTQSLTQRPKADMAQVIGLSTASSQSSYGQGGYLDELETTIQAKIMADYGTDHGFFSSAVDPLSPVDDSYTAVRKFRKKVIDQSGSSEPNMEINVATGKEEQLGWKDNPATYKTISTEEGSTTDYGLKNLVKARRAKVEAYVLSLTYQGLRG
jgi:hypothetical protein